mmetsp:Transcript_38254/g.69265  ORF Transcript_38254/g.69265 Transcript_38254/m.69265 type:complete len:198 (+) Transcript_38254:91-684(+)|eukprot:CAMPEP_0115088582 /NCGR_PEP_ID=MMETSP0227-20121206/24085_1 /TAXON_ID=89957 /ORGANISM="Polarella glacialis, Strain CCMP 1383" /LENGTH=197 /DNA_ID=CAMNT_0002478895 /DNA_START=91 /DNA_END=684 /DNA_ORIENTATION=-
MAIGIAQKVRKQRELAQKRADAQQHAEIQGLFERFDSTKTGVLDREEVRSLLAAFHEGKPPTEDELTFVMKTTGHRDRSTPNFEIACSELMDAINCWKCYLSQFEDEHSMGSSLFAKYDSDKTGKLDSKQLKGLLAEMNGAPVSDIDLEWVLGRADVLRDGQIAKIELNQAIACWFQKQAQSLPMPEPQKSTACILL